MQNYDETVLGVLNCLHPANREENEVFYSENIQECLDYYKETKDIEPLENAVSLQKDKLDIVVSSLTEFIHFLRKKDLNDTANYLCMINEEIRKL
jgi:vacuolar-type H+-ATPase subunit I/STV1